MCVVGGSQWESQPEQAGVCGESGGCLRWAERKRRSKALDFRFVPGQQRIFCVQVGISLGGMCKRKDIVEWGTVHLQKVRKAGKE